jgi:hypothetical protein
MEIPSPEKEAEFKPEIDEKGNLILKKKVNIKRGKKSRSGGSQFELRVRKDLQERGFIIDKWSNNVDLDLGEIVPAKRVFKRFKANMGVMTIGTGFPDFIAFQKRGEYYSIIGVEVKQNNTLSKIEKEKCAWYLDNKIFREVWIASKGKEGRRVKVIYEDFSSRYKKYLKDGDK